MSATTRIPQTTGAASVPRPAPTKPAAASCPEVPPLSAGDRLSRDEFLRRWEAMPGLKRAELIGGIVYMPSPVGEEHGDSENFIGTLLGVYRIRTPGTKAGNNSTLLISKDEAPQADVHLRILAEYGGQTRSEGSLIAGAPEFCAEVCLTSAAYDLNQKKAAYEAAGVREYLAVLIWEGELRFFRRGAAGFDPELIPADGIIRSQVFPGLWINAPAVLADDAVAALDTLEAGLKSPEHAEFVRTLAERRR